MTAETSAQTSPGMRTFFAVWFGQLVSLVGTGLTNFGLSVWILQETGSVTQFTLISVASVLPGILVSPFAGAVADRYDRRRVMMIADSVAGLTTLAIVLLLAAGQLQAWHIFITSAISATANAFQMPAYWASVSLLVPKQHQGRASGLMRMADAVSLILAPALAGVLVLRIGLPGIIAIDFVTFFVAVSTVALVRFPALPHRDGPAKARPSLWQDVREGWRYLGERPGLLWMTLYFTAMYFFYALASILINPLVLTFSNSEGLAVVVSAVGAGLLCGGFLMSAWGGFKRRMWGIYLYGVIQAVTLIAAGLRPDVALVAVAFFVLALGSPIAEASGQAIRMAKVPPQLMGRIMSIARVGSWGAIPLAYLLAGPLSDVVFEPLMQPGGGLAGSVGPVIGVGPGRGIALVVIVCGLLTLVLTVAAFANARLRRVDIDLPDVAPPTPEPSLEPELEAATA